MKTWMLLLVLLLVACAAAFGWQALAHDPGYVLIRLGDTSIETSAVFALVALLVLWGLISLAARLVRWPLAAWSRRSRRRGRERIANGLVALAEGRYAHALRELERASHLSGLEAPALLAAARAAHARGDAARTQAELARADEVAAPAALALRARFLVEQGDPAAALALLTAKVGRPDPSVVPSRNKVDKSTLVPMAWRMLAESALACGDVVHARLALDALNGSQALSPQAFADLESRTLAATLAGATDAAHLQTLWSGFTRAQRRSPDVLGAYARRAAALGQTLAAVSELEDALRREWSEPLARAYGELGPAEVDTRLRHAEGWLAAQPNSAALLLTLGRLCNQSGLWGKAAEYLERGLAIEPSPALWEAYGDAARGQGGETNAQSAYRNALRLVRGEATLPLAASRLSALDTRALMIEERTEHGVPRLPRSA
ncbi:MAG TPA: heme biosynthesis HemY N-terminal domain-containing protein [Rudaea sp.]